MEPLQPKKELNCESELQLDRKIIKKTKHLNRELEVAIIILVILFIIADVVAIYYINAYYRVKDNSTPNPQAPQGQTNNNNNQSTRQDSSTNSFSIITSRSFLAGV